jgi:TolB-like protein/Tfp pilus assembly protein PilF
MSGGSDHDDTSPPAAAGVRAEAMSSLLKELLVQGTARDQPSRGAPKPGAMVGRFELIRELGRGGFGVVHEARDVQLQRPVAVKLLQAGEAGFSEQLQREAELVARLSHPNLVTLFDVGLSQFGPYLVLELLKGQTLQQRLEAGPLPVAEAVHVGVEVARGLAYAHSEGVVHRDLKPSNVFLTARGAVKILDFGMAHAFGRRRVSGGTPAYMAPEQWEEAPEDERTDVFALGVMLHRMLTGGYPYPEDGGRWSSGAAEPAGLEVPGSPELGKLVRRMLERGPTRRPRDGAEVLAALERIGKGLPATPDGAPPVRATRKKASFSDLVTELKRRRVFRVMAGYGIFTFAVLQVIEPIMHGAHLPDWVLTAVLVALAVGFPVAVVLSWLFDLTADGVKRTPAATGPGGLRLSRARLAAVLLGVGLLAALPGLGWYAWKRGREAAPVVPATDGTASIAVLPFADLSPNHDQDYFADGVAEEILNALAHVEGLRVPGRTSSFWFKGKDARLADIGRELNVTHVLEGSVRRAGTRLRVTAQVVKVADGYHLWSETFDRPEADVFAVQDQVARAVVEALKVKLLPGAREPEPRRTSPSLGAYDQYLLGTQFLARYTDQGSELGVAALEKAVALDPGMAPAWAKLSFGYYLLADLVDTPQEAERRRRSLAAAERAASLDPGLGEALAARALVRLEYQFDFAGAAADLRRARALSPSDPFVLVTTCYIERNLGKLAESAAACQRAIEVDPLSTRNRNQAFYTAVSLGQLAQARAFNVRALELAPDSAWNLESRCVIDLLEGLRGPAQDHCGTLPKEASRLFHEAVLAARWGAPGEARAAAQRWSARYGQHDPYGVAQVYGVIGDADRAFEQLERAYRLRLGLGSLQADYQFDGLRADPRYQALLKKLKLPAD